MSFEILQKNYNIPKSHSFRFLQIRSFVGLNLHARQLTMLWMTY